MYSCTFIGHSDCYNYESVEEKLYLAIERLIVEKSVSTFYVGTHGRFDKYAYMVLCELEKIYQIKVFVVLSHMHTIPEYCTNAKLLYPESVKKTPYKFAIVKRNEYMIKNSQFMICYINNSFSNTYNFVKLALNKKLEIVNLGEFEISKI